MAKRQVSLKGRGPELFGRGIDLLFGDPDEEQPPQKPSPVSPSFVEEQTGTAALDDPPVLAGLSAEMDAALGKDELAEPVTLGRGIKDTPGPRVNGHDDAHLRAAAQEFLAQSVPARRLSSPEQAPRGGLASPGKLREQPQPLEFDLPPLPGQEDLLPPELAQGLPPAKDFGPTNGPGYAEIETTLPPSAAEPVSAGPFPAAAEAADAIQTSGPIPSAESVRPSIAPLSSQPVSPAPPAMPVAPSASAPEATMPEQPSPAPSPPSDGMGSPDATASQERDEAPPRAVGAPGVRISGPVTEVSGAYQARDGRLDPSLLDYEAQTLTDIERREILRRLKDLDPDYLVKLDREIERLYKKVADVMSGEEESKTAFAALRKARLVVLLEPERFAEAEYLIQQVRAALHRIEVSVEAGKHYGSRLLAYNIVWLVFFGAFALLTTVPGNFFFDWASFLLGVPVESEGLGYAMMLMSTLAWGGIGGVTGALWSLHYHISVARDYDPVENMWYLEQPLLGMVLGGIVYLIMASGFLVVQADLSSSSAGLGARLLPAAVAVVVGFRQTVVLDLIERIVQLLAPQPENKGPQRPTI